MHLAAKRQSLPPSDNYVHRRRKVTQAPSRQAQSLEFTVERSEIVHTSSDVAVLLSTAVSVPIILGSSEAAAARANHLVRARVVLPVLDRFDVSAVTPKALYQGKWHHWQRWELGLTGSG